MDSLGTQQPHLEKAGEIVNGDVPCGAICLRLIMLKSKQLRNPLCSFLILLSI